MRLIPYMLAAGLFAAPAMAAELTGTLQKVKETGTITLGVRDSSVPFSYLDDKQKPVGYAVDICYKIIDAVKAALKLPDLKVQLVPVAVIQPHPVDGERHHRSGMRVDHQQCRTAEAGRLHQHPFPDRKPVCLQEVRPSPI